jgi:hypothetical protein
VAKISIKAGTTSKLLDVFIQDSSSTVGAGLTGLAFGTGSLTAYYYREGAASATLISLLTMTLGTWTTCGFIVIDGTNMPGMYQLGIPDAAIAAGAKSCVVMLKGAANMAPLVLEIELTAVDNQSATAFITGVNSLAPPANWNTDVVQTGDAYARIGAAGASLTGITGVALAAGQKVDVDTIKTNPVVNGGTVTFTTNSTVASTANITGGTITTVTNLTNAPTVGDLTAAMKSSVTTAATAATPAVASVTAGVTVAVGGIPSGGNAAAELNNIADATLDRNMATGVDSGTDSTVVRTLRQAVRALRNKVTIAGGVATITKENDTTASWTAAIATTAGNPISGVDPT